MPFPFRGDLPDPGSECVFLASAALAGDFFTTSPPGKSLSVIYCKEMGKHHGQLRDIC